MSLREEKDDTIKNFREAIQVSKVEMRKYLIELSKEDRFRILREDLSLKGIEKLCERASPEDYEICASVE